MRCPNPEISNQTVRRKEIYEALHPETRHGENQHTRSRKICDSNSRFTSETARATGKSERAIQLDAARGEALGEDLNRIAGTSLDKGVELDASPDEADRAEATALWAKLTMKGAGNPTGANQHTKPAEGGIFDNVQDSSKAPTGNSKDAGMRRLIPPGGVDDAQYCRTSDRTHEPTGAQSGRRRRQREAPRWGSRMRSRGCSWINPRF